MERPKNVLPPDPPVQPQVAQSETAPPEIARPDIAQSKIAQPKIAQPEIAQPEIAQPEIAQPKIAQPKMEQPNVDQPKAPPPPPQHEPSTSAPAQPATAAQAVLAHPTTQNAIKLAGEAIMPGASLLMDGKILHGGAHLLAGAVAKAFLGPVGIAVVIANSYSNSTTGKNLLEQLQRFMPPKTE